MSRRSPGHRPVLIPQPRELSLVGGQQPVGWLTRTQLPDFLADCGDHFDELLAQVGGDPAGPELPVTVAANAGPPESYRLTVVGGAVQISAADPLGLLYAARTLVDLYDSTDGAALPEVRVADHPTFPVRGLFAESFAGTDLMELADWQELIDRLGALKFNTLGIAIYGCWQLGYDRDRTEYLFTPVPEYPQLRTPQRVVTWDPVPGQETELRYLPRMFEQDFFGEVVRYAADRGIEVIPQLGGPGHSSLIPRLVPELSAWDETGTPTGYGYCVSRPQARSALVDLMGALVRGQLAPAGVRRLHVAADEVYPIRNTDPDDPRRVVSPYCQCPGCRERSPGELLIEYLVAVGRVLAEHGVTMVNWQDTLVREKVLDAYLDRIAAEGLPEPVIVWWKYNDPVPVADASRAQTWVAPTTGLFSPLFTQDFTPHIETVLRRGHRAGAVGTFAYTMPDPADHTNLACLADLSWNLEGSGGAIGFWRRWAELTCPDDPDRAQHAALMVRTITTSYPLMLYIVDHLLPYFATAAAGVTTYPDDLVRAFSIPQPGLADVLRQVRDTMRDAESEMPPGRPIRGWPDPTRGWRAQIRRLADALDLFLGLLGAVRDPDPPAEQERRLVERGRALLELVAETTPGYLAPSVLREHWVLVRQLPEVAARMRQDPGVAGAESWYAWIV